MQRRATATPAPRTGPPGPEICERVGSDLAFIRTALHDALAEGQRLGQLRPDADLAGAASALPIAFVGCQLTVRAQLDRTPTRESSTTCSHPSPHTLRTDR